MYRAWLFNVASFLALVAAVYHLAGIFYPINSSPPWRHAVFAGICLICSYGLAKRPKFFVYFFFLLLVQQFYSHGLSLLDQWAIDNKVDWISLLLLCFLPVIFFNLVIELRDEH